ncbi:hypothetical protein HN51_059723 [Arachis hypogaea]
MEASWKSPIVFVIENNLWAIWNLDVTSATSIPQEWKNRPAFGMPGIQAVDVAEDLSLEDMMAEDDGEALELFYQCRCGDYFSIDSLELHKIGYSLLRDESRISILNNDSLLGLLILPCGSCSLKAHLVINMDGH